MVTEIKIKTQKVEKILTWYADHKLSTGTLLQSSKGHLMRVIEYWPAGEAGMDISKYGLLTITTNQFMWVEEYKVLKGIEEGSMWEVQIVTN